tara:strand:+ start:69 stop:599 length:531 start_codon:yes stop_codon:yes gene_type:complete
MKKTFGVLIIGIIGSIIASFIYDSIKDQPLLSTLETALLFLKNFIVLILSIKVSLWKILGIAVLLISAIKGYHFFQSRKTPKPPDYTSYVEDQFHSWVWKWDWKYDFQTESWVVTNLVPYCDDCLVRLIDRSNYLRANAECPNCKNRYSSAYDNYEYNDSILNLIYGKIENNEYAS